MCFEDLDDRPAFGGKDVAAIAVILGLILLVFFSIGCGGAGPTNPTEEALALGSIQRDGDYIVFTIEGAQRADFVAELWDKAVSGTSREVGAAVYRSGPLGNGTHRVDASKWACLDLQADLGTGSGLLRSKQFARWGVCPTPPPTPRPSPSPSPTPPPQCNNPAVTFQGFEVDEGGTVRAGFDVSGVGVWELRLHAASTLEEALANDPDYVKDTDSAENGCTGLGQLRVSYNWRGHPSGYWWWALYYQGQVFSVGTPIVKASR